MKQKLLLLEENLHFFTNFSKPSVLSECANTSAHCYLTHGLRLRLKEGALGLCPNYLLQHCHHHQRPLHQHHHQHHLLHRRLLRRRSPLEQLPQGDLVGVLGGILKSSKLNRCSFSSLLFTLLHPLSVFLCSCLDLDVWCNVFYV